MGRRESQPLHASSILPEQVAHVTAETTHNSQTFSCGLTVMILQGDFRSSTLDGATSLILCGLRLPGS